MSTTQLQLTGLCCGNEAAQVERKVGELPGVSEARVNPATFKLTVKGDAPLAAIESTIAELGYESTPLKEGASGFAAPPRQTWDEIALAVGSGLALAIGWALEWKGFSLTSQPVVASYAVAALVGGYRTFWKGLKSVKALTFDMNALMLIGVAGAVGIGAWGEAASVAFLYAVSNFLEESATARTRGAIQSLVALAPPQALVRRDGVERLLDVSQVLPGDLIVIRPGERIALDGEVVTGESAVDQAPITGESMPVAKGPGEGVFAGTINGARALEVRVTKASHDSTLARIIHMVEEAQGQRSNIQSTVDRFARWYTPSVLIFAALVAAIPTLLGYDFHVWCYKALSLIVLACPCALVISTPVALVAGIGNAARRGVLIKGGRYLEQAASLKVIALDKTGTLTQGRPTVQEVASCGGRGTAEVIALAAAVETRSEHPLAAAILAHAESQKLPLAAASCFEAVIGHGAHALVDGRQIYVGSPRLFTKLGLPLGEAAELAAELQADGQTVVVVGDADGPIGVIGVSDPVRASARRVVERLKAAGIERVVMLTGDNATTAAAIARQVGVDEVKADLLPEDKVAAILALEKQYGRVAMVGDGINDAPALATAHLGIAMGTAGTDVAIETADVALMGDDIARLPFMITLSRATMGVIRQNIAFAIGVKVVATIIVFPGWLTLWMAVLADMGATVLVTLNALRLLNLTPEEAPHSHDHDHDHGPAAPHEHVHGEACSHDHGEAVAPH